MRLFKLFIFGLFVALSFAVFGQNDTTTNEVFNQLPLLTQISDYTYLIVALLIAIYEILARVRKTDRNASILDFLHSIVNYVFPNRKKQKGLNSRDLKDKFKIK